MIPAIESRSIQAWLDNIFTLARLLSQLDDEGFGAADVLELTPCVGLIALHFDGFYLYGKS